MQVGLYLIFSCQPWMTLLCISIELSAGAHTDVDAIVGVQRTAGLKAISILTRTVLTSQNTYNQVTAWLDVLKPTESTTSTDFTIPKPKYVFPWFPFIGYLPIFPHPSVSSDTWILIVC